MARVLIAGCGYIGTGLGLALGKEGHEVWGIRRTSAPLSSPIKTLVGDLTEAEKVPELPDNLDYIFYTAAAPSFTDEGYQATYVNGMRHLLRQLDRLGQTPKRVIFASSTGVYAQMNGELVDEDSPAEAVHFSGKRILEAARFLHRHKFPAISVRFGSIYGPSRVRLVQEVLTGKARLYENDVYTNRIHRDDCIGVLRHLMTLKNPAEVYLGIDNEPVSHNELVEWLAEQLSAPEPIYSHDAAPLSRTRSNKRCCNKRLRASGYEFRYPTYREGYMAILEEMDL